MLSVMTPPMVRSIFRGMCANGLVDALAKLASPTFTVFNHALPCLTGTSEASSQCLDYSQTSHKDSKQVVKLSRKIQL